MTALIRSVDGQETPAPGLWTIAPGHPVDARSGPWWRTIRVTGRVTAGHLLVTDSGSMALRLAVDVPGAPGGTPTSLTYQSIRMTSGARADQWVVDGDLVAGHQIVAARSVLNYHGVYRSGPGALAWLGWRLASSGIRGARAAGARWALAANLNADAPGGLATARASAG